jgi:peptidyl-prolyl cis-trans isomerase A (cyclophilin A)
VLEGMDVVHKILEQPRDLDAGEGDMKGQMLATPVQIVTVRRAG